MTLSWTECDCCGSRDYVRPVTDTGLTPYLCANCRDGRHEDGACVEMIASTMTG